jgi:hypothetical protein
MKTERRCPQALHFPQLPQMIRSVAANRTLGDFAGCVVTPSICDGSDDIIVCHAMIAGPGSEKPLRSMFGIKNANKLKEIEKLLKETMECAMN